MALALNLNTQVQKARGFVVDRVEGLQRNILGHLLFINLCRTSHRTAMHNARALALAPLRLRLPFVFEIDGPVSRFIGRAFV